jgi:transposase-like protein
MNLTQFLKRFDSEQKCIDFFKTSKEELGIKFQKCQSESLRWIGTRLCWTCNKCSNRFGLKKNSVLENSKLSYRLWLTSLYLMVMTKKGYSALEMQRIPGHKRYEPIWLMMHKIRACMGMRDEKYTLDGFVKLDKGFLLVIEKSQLSLLAKCQKSYLEMKKYWLQ